MVHVYMIHDKLIVRNAKFHQMTGKMITYLSNVKKPILYSPRMSRSGEYNDLFLQNVGYQPISKVEIN